MLPLRGVQAVGDHRLQIRCCSSRTFGEETGQREEPSVYRRGECTPQRGGGLGLASMGRLNALMGHTTEHRVHSGAGIPWIGLVPLVVCGYPVDRNRSSCQVILPLQASDCSQRSPMDGTSCQRKHGRDGRRSPWSISKVGQCRVVG